MNYESMYKRIVKRKRRMYEQCEIKKKEPLRHSNNQRIKGKTTPGSIACTRKQQTQFC